MKPDTPPNGHMPQRPAPDREFSMRFTSTPRGARLARRLVSHRLDDWGHPYTTPVNETLTLITAELTANAVRHGHVPGRDFHVQLTLAENTFRIEVTDTRVEKQPPASPQATDSLSESGRGLLLVAALSDGWGVSPRRAAPGKTVWAELHVRAKGHPLTHRVAPEPTDVDLLLVTASLLRDDLGLRPEDASHGGHRP
ncbi:ATP-binding protein [Streptomyces sp. HB132]|uniref:ATP-binding protein n=1 Tax=Streptomyces sp. HB132 TaxID=767388 RepID=UPI001D639A30|nr:ATP-binding protein [Streptomyces sp. HB132]MBM7438851.1 anti-sigma regulatory factor (Ser/Thr protein kinase) [Streptomyces sp. HB132]